jgi:endonuclease-3
MDLARLTIIHDRLAAYYGEPVLIPDYDPLGGLIATILSQSTSDANSDRAYADLRAAFVDWDAVRAAPEPLVADAIRRGGLANLKAARIQSVLTALIGSLPQDGGSLDARFAAWLSRMPVADARRALQRLPGVGPKTAACVLLFSLGMPSFPVDTHVYRISQRLAFIGANTSVANAHAAYDASLPADLVYPLHILFIRHGRALCKARHPRCPECPLRDICPEGQRRVGTGG